jgi:hypothetical protein
MADYSQDWEEYRKRRNLALGIGFSIFPVKLLIWGISRVLHNDGVFSVVEGVLTFCWLSGTIIASYYAQFCPCPRCGKQFSNKWWYHKGMAFARRCVHCGLRKYANDDSPIS